MKSKKVFFLTFLLWNQTSKAVLTDEVRSSYLKAFYQSDLVDQTLFRAQNPIRDLTNEENLALEASLKKLEMLRNLEREVISVQNESEKEKIYGVWKNFATFFLFKENNVLAECLKEKDRALFAQFSKQNNLKSKTTHLNQIEEQLYHIYTSGIDEKSQSFRAELSPRTQLDFDLDVKKLEAIKTLQIQQAQANPLALSLVQEAIKKLSDMLNFKSLTACIQNAQDLTAMQVKSEEVEADLQKLKAIQALQSEAAESPFKQALLAQAIDSLKNLIIHQDLILSNEGLQSVQKNSEDLSFSSQSIRQILHSETGNIPETGNMSSKLEVITADSKVAQQKIDTEVNVSPFSLEQYGAMQTGALLKAVYETGKPLSESAEFLREYQLLSETEKIDFDADWKKLETIALLQKEKQKNPDDADNVEALIQSLTDLLTFKDVLEPLVDRRTNAKSDLQDPSTDLPEEHPKKSAFIDEESDDIDPADNSLMQKKDLESRMFNFDDLRHSLENYDMPGLWQKPQEALPSFEDDVRDYFLDIYRECFDTRDWRPEYDLASVNDMDKDQKEIVSSNMAIFQELIRESDVFYQTAKKADLFPKDEICFFYRLLKNQVERFTIQKLKSGFEEELIKRISVLEQEDQKIYDGPGQTVDQRFRELCLYQTFFNAFKNGLTVEQEKSFFKTIDDAGEEDAEDGDACALLAQILKRVMFLSTRYLSIKDLPEKDKIPVLEDIIEKVDNTPVEGFCAAFLPFLKSELSLAQAPLPSIDAPDFDREVAKKIQRAYQTKKEKNIWDESLLVFQNTLTQEQQDLLSADVRVVEKIFEQDEVYKSEEEKMGLFKAEKSDYFQFLLEKIVPHIANQGLQSFFQKIYEEKIEALEKEKEEETNLFSKLEQKHGVKMQSIYTSLFAKLKSKAKPDDIYDSFSKAIQKLSFSNTEKENMPLLLQRMKFLIEANVSLENDDALSLYEKKVLLNKMIERAEQIPLEGLRKWFADYHRNKREALVIKYKNRDRQLAIRLENVWLPILENYVPKTGIMPEYDDSELTHLSEEEKDVFNRNVGSIRQIIEEEGEFYKKESYSPEDELDLLIGLKKKAVGGFQLLMKGFRQKFKERIDRIRNNRDLDHNQKSWISDFFRKAWTQFSAQKQTIFNHNQIVEDLFQSKVLKGYDNEKNKSVVSFEVGYFFDFLNLFQKYAPKFALAATTDEIDNTMDTILESCRKKASENIHFSKTGISFTLLSELAEQIQNSSAHDLQYLDRAASYYLAQKMLYQNQKRSIEVKDAFCQIDTEIDKTGPDSKSSINHEISENSDFDKATQTLGQEGQGGKKKKKTNP